jgi:hypothetical protein
VDRDDFCDGAVWAWDILVTECGFADPKEKKNE